MYNPKLIEVRCDGCKLLLAKVDGNAEITCRKCHGTNYFDIGTKKIKFIPVPRKPERTLSSGVRFYD